MRHSAFLGAFLAAAVARGLDLAGLGRPLGIQPALAEVPNRPAPRPKERVERTGGQFVIHHFLARKRPMRVRVPLLRAHAIDANMYSGEDLRRIRADPTRAECQRRKAQMARIAEKRAAKPMRWAA
jgi:hypothetical protein